MNNREKIQRAFSALHASEGTTMEVLRRMENKTHKTHTYRKHFAVLLAAAIVLSALSIVAFAFTRRWDFGSAHAYVESRENESKVSFDLDSPGPIRSADGRIYLEVNGESVEITTQLSKEQAYIYRYHDGEGVEHILLVGLDNEGAPGWAEYMKSADGAWIGGIAHNHMDPTGMGDSYPWYKSGKADINCPWP